MGPFHLFLFLKFSLHGRSNESDEIGGHGFHHHIWVLGLGKKKKSRDLKQIQE
jgi:hypothetical protein